MSLRLFNTLTGKKEEFKPLQDGVVKMYHCGPTVYNYAHIGNLRPYVFADTLRRTCEYLGLRVEQVINITDIGHLTSDADSGDDKMVKGLKREGLPLSLEGLSKLAHKYEHAFREDLAMLNIRTAQHYPRATENLTEEIEVIQKLEENGFAYKLEDGVYFDTGKLGDAYGKLGGLTPVDESVARIGAEGKKSPRDFVLWKLSKDDHLGFPSPWGTGFPGWHVECSAMSRKFLGQPFDIHTGGIDHIPVHHNNEIAQSEAAYGTPLANFWLHSAFVNIEGAKMAKSADNFLTLNDLELPPLAYRYFLLSGHYRSPLSFSDNALLAAYRAFNKLVDFLVGYDDSGSVSSEYKTKFIDAIENDLNTPQALAVLWEMVKDKNVSEEDVKATILGFDKVLGLHLLEESKKLQKAIEDHESEESVPAEVRELMGAREIARANKDFAKSDELRKQIEEKGFIVKDTSDGQKILPK